MTFLEELQAQTGLLGNQIRQSSPFATYTPTSERTIQGVPQNYFDPATNQFMMPEMTGMGGTMTGVGTGTGTAFGTYTPGAFGQVFGSQAGTGGLMGTGATGTTGATGGGGRDPGYYTFQGGDVPLSEFDPSAFTELPFPSVIGIVTGLLNDIVGGDATQDEIDTFNKITASNPTASYSALTNFLTEGNVIDTTGLTPIGIQGTVMTTPSGDTYIGDPVTGQGVNQNPINNIVDPATSTISTTSTGDTYYSGPLGNQGNTGGNTGGNIGGFSGGGFCFDPNTLVEMLDGTEKKIKHIVLGDKTRGGEVTGVFQFKAADEIHDYKGVTVAGSHYVKENGNFIMVQDSPLSVKINKIPVVYSLDTTQRRIWIKNIEFADYNGDSIAKSFLHNAGVGLSGFDKEVLRQVENRLI